MRVSNVSVCDVCVAKNVYERFLEWRDEGLYV